MFLLCRLEVHYEKSGWKEEYKWRTEAAQAAPPSGRHREALPPSGIGTVPGSRRFGEIRTSDSPGPGPAITLQIQTRVWICVLLAGLVA